MQKKTSLTELFYLTLLITALRPPESGLHFRRERSWRSSTETLGPIVADDICLNNANRFLNSNGAFCSNYYSAKNSVLLDETHQVLEYINSLGRYSEPAPFRSNLFAYPMSGGLADQAEANSLTFSTAEIEDDTSTSLFSPFQPEFAASPAAATTNIEPDTLSLTTDFDTFNFTNLEDLSLDLFDLNDEDGFFNESGNLFDSTHDHQQQQQHDGNTEGTLGSTGSDPFAANIDVDELLLADSSVMFPILDHNDGDVNDLFGELELLLSNETESYGQEWQSSATFYNQLPSGEAAADYSLYESATNLAPAEPPRPIENCAVYDAPASSSAQMSAPSGSFSNNFSSNFSAVLCSSLTTLSNGTDHLGNDIAPSHLVYNSDINDLAYMSNVSNLSVNNVSTSDCFYNGYLPDELPIAEVTTANASQFSYPSQPPQQPPCYSTSSISHGNGNQFSAPPTEDCFDKSSDSAVSSMSSDRVHSSSENEWAETSSESSYNGEVNMSDCKYNAAAQKKYRLFGKNKSADLKSTTPQEYYIDYGHNYMYPGAVSSADDSYAMGYYATVVGHNHTYAQPAPEVVPLSAVPENVPSNSWPANENGEQLNSSAKKPEATRSSTKSSTKKQQQQQQQQQSQASSLEVNKKDPHLNRDEKRARALKIPISTADIINLPIDEFNERLTKYELTEMQLSLIRDIRRRGKNKVAAQNCRKRKLDQIMGLQSEVDNMFMQKSTLEAQYNQLILLRELARDKYAKLYQFVVEASSSRQHFELTASPPDFPDKDSSQEVQLNDNVGNSFVVSTNLTSAVPVPSYGVQGEFSKQE